MESFVEIYGELSNSIFREIDKIQIKIVEYEKEINKIEEQIKSTQAQINFYEEEREKLKKEKFEIQEKFGKDDEKKFKEYESKKREYEKLANETPTIEMLRNGTLLKIFLKISEENGSCAVCQKNLQTKIFKTMLTFWDLD